MLRLVSEADTVIDGDAKISESYPRCGMRDTKRMRSNLLRNVGIWNIFFFFLLLLLFFRAANLIPFHS